MTPWHDCAPCHFLPDGSPSATDPPSGQLNVPANSRQPSPRGTLPAYRLSNSARHGRTAANIVPVCLPHAALIPIYWNRAYPVRLPLPIIHGVNASDHRFGGFGISEKRRPPLFPQTKTKDSSLTTNPGPKGSNSATPWSFVASRIGKRIRIIRQQCDGFVHRPECDEGPALDWQQDPVRSPFLVHEPVVGETSSGG